MKKILPNVGIAVIAVLVLIQLVPVDRSNLPVVSDIATSSEVKAVLKRSCYDCHSHETVWPLYSRIAPVSWLVAKDVYAGRDELNFSTWNQYSTKEQVRKLHESWEEVEEGEMPLWFYLTVHRNAELSADDRAVLRAWSLEALNYERDGKKHDEDDKDKD